MNSFYRKGIEASLLLYALSLPLSMSGTNIALGLLLGFTLWKVGAEKISTPVPCSIYVLLAFFLWAAFTECLAAGGFELLSLGSFSKVWNFFPIILIPLSAVQNHSLKRIFAVLFSAASLVVLLGFLEYSFGFREMLIHQGRFYGFQSHPLHSGGLYCLLSLSALGMCLFAENWKSLKFFWGGSSLVLALGVALTFSRSYYLALALGFIFLLAFKGIKPLLIGVLLGALLVAGLSALNQNFRQRLSTISVAHTDESANIRTKLWKAAGLMIKDHPLVGVGYHGWRNHILLYSRNYPGWFMDQAAYAHAHNSYLTVAAETGIPGLLLFGGFWAFLIREQIGTLRSAVKEGVSYPLALSGLAGIFALLLAAFFEHNLLTATICLSLFFLIGLSRIPEPALGRPNAGSRAKSGGE